MTIPATGEALLSKTGDAARRWARRAVLGITHESGGRIVIFPAVPVYCRCTPAEHRPDFSNPVSSATSTATGSLVGATGFEPVTPRL